MPLDYDQFDNAARLSVAGLAIRLDLLQHLPHAIERALGDGTSADARCRFRRLVHDQAPEETIARLVHRRLGAADETRNPLLTAVS
jgi:UDP:flavonoid glycosyltransferase YjiC (YdhE family)